MQHSFPFRPAVGRASAAPLDILSGPVSKPAAGSTSCLCARADRSRVDGADRRAGARCAAHRGVHPNDVALKKWREVPLIAKVVLVPDMHNDRVNVYPYKMRKLPPGSLPPRPADAEVHASNRCACQTCLPAMLCSVCSMYPNAHICIFAKCGILEVVLAFSAFSCVPFYIPYSILKNEPHPCNTLNI